MIKNKVKIFAETHADILEDRVNKFIARAGVVVIGIQFQKGGEERFARPYCAMIWYAEEERS